MSNSAGTRLDAIAATSSGGAVHVVVETPRGSSAKFKFDSTLGAIILSRPLPAGIVYPHDWGFVPSTLAADGDPLDAVVLWEGTSYPGVVLPCRLLGALELDQVNATTGARERNDRLIAVPLRSVSMQSVSSIADLSERARAELEGFFTAAVRFERKELRVLGWTGREQAEALLTTAAAAWRR